MVLREDSGSLGGASCPGRSHLDWIEGVEHTVAQTCVTTETQR